MTEQNENKEQDQNQEAPEQVQTTQGKHSIGMLNTEKDTLIGEELKLVTVEKATTKIDDTDREFYTFYATRTSDGIMLSFYGSSVLNSQYDKDQLKAGMHFVIDKVVSKAGNTYYKAIILNGRDE